VTVKTVKTLVQSGKAIRFSRGKNRYPGTTTRSDSKKAYATLAEGSSIAVFEQPAEETKEEKK
jgi:ribosomal protein L23